MIRELRRFNDEGLVSAEQLLDFIDEKGDGPWVELLEDEKLTEPMGISIEIIPFKDRFHAAAHLHAALEPIGSHPDLIIDSGLWTWLALAWLDELAPAVLGVRRLRARPRWVLAADDYTRYYRHLLAGPYRIYVAHLENPERARAVLATDVAKPGEVVEQFASRQNLVTSPGVMDSLTHLYYDAVTQKLRRGASSKGSGSSRRFADLLQQLDLTYDIYEMSVGEILSLLPQEFDKFKDHSDV